MAGNRVSLVIKGGTVVDPESGRVEKADVLISGGKIEKIGGAPSGEKTINAAGLIVTPGLVDMHVHLREPGFEHKETIQSGVQAAAAGGFTTVVAMANTGNVIDDQTKIEYVNSIAAKLDSVRVLQCGAVTKGLKGEELAEMGLMAKFGAAAFSDDGIPIANANLMRRALEYSKMLGKVIIDHCEDPQLSKLGTMNECAEAVRRGIPGLPAVAEDTIVARDLMLAKFTGARIHITHASTSASAALIRSAKKDGVKVTCDVTPHHIAFTDEKALELNTRFKMKPPLRGREDVKALVQAVCDGVVDAIASDHAPHSRSEKDDEFANAPFGVVGLETTVGAVFTYLLKPGLLELPALVRLLTLGPCRALGIDGGRIAPGERGDVTIIDPKKEWTVDAEKFKSKGRHSPFDGMRLSGRVLAAISCGKLLHTEL